jgi:hypothetical protein
MSSGSKKRKPNTHFLFLSKVPLNEPPAPPGSPTGPLWRQLPVYRVFLHISQNPRKNISPNKDIFPSLKGPRKGASIYFPPKQSPYGNRHPFPEPYLEHPSRFPVKELSLHVTLIELSRREMLHPYRTPSFIFQRPQYKSHLPGSPAAPSMVRDARLRGKCVSNAANTAHI